MRILLSLSLIAASAALAASPSFLEKHFANPPSEFRTMPFFVWNGEVTEADIDKYLADYKAQGIGGVFIHPRIGLITPYLSDRWFALFRYAVEKGKSMGMQVWIYDENPFPSGAAGGHVAAEMPESYSEGQGLTLKKVTAPSETCRVLLRKSPGGFADVTGRPDAGPDEYYCFELAYYGRRGRGYVDLIRPGVTEKFLQVTMPGYERSVGSEFGRTVPGVFTDEPNLAPPGNGAVRWTPDFFAQFEKRRGYDVRPQLVSMFEDTGDYRRVRHDWYATLLELFIERWSKPWYEYTEKKGLKWTGHYWEHGWPSPNDGPDNMAMYPYHQVPGIDLLFNQYDEEGGDQFGNVRNVKELSSVANQFGRARTLSETYGGGGWELRFEDMKRLGDWEYVLGVNLMNQHLSFETLAGARKFDWPQSFSYHEPWWNHYRVLAVYFGRLSMALSQGEQVNRVLIIEPTTTAWMYARTSKEPDPRLMGVDRAFRPLLNRLERLQAEYDLASENILAGHAKVSGKQFVVGKRAYDIVVIPPGTENLDGPTVALLARYLEAGGQVLSFVDTPGRVDGAESGHIRDLAVRHPSQWRRVGSLEDEAVRNILCTGDFSAVTGDLYHQRRRLADGELLFFMNSSLDAPARASVRVSGRSLTSLDALTGAMNPYPARAESGRLAFEVELPPAGSLLVLAKNTGVPVAAKPAVKGGEAPATAAGPMTVKRVSPNVLRLDYCDLKIGGSVQQDMPFYTAMDRVFQHYGFRGDPWAGTQFKTEFLDRGQFPAGSGFETVFHFDVGNGVNTASMQAVVERPRLWHVSVNGKPVTAKPGAWWLDTAFGVYDIGPYVKPGANEITVKAEPMSVHAEVQPVFVLGEFGVAAQDKGFRIVPANELQAGPWNNQGLPFYSNLVSYRRAYEVKGGGVWKVALGKWAGTLAEVKVNGEPAGIVGWQPYEIDVTRFVRPGKNQVEVLVYGSLKNVLGPHHNVNRRGIVGPWMWRYVPEHTPPGSKYDLLGYGLFEDFRLVRR